MGPLAPMLARLAQSPGARNVMNRASGWPSAVIKAMENSTLWRMLSRQGREFRASPSEFVGEFSRNLASRPSHMPGGADINPELVKAVPQALQRNVPYLPNALVEPEEAQRLFQLFQYYMIP